ncbi:UDP-N-acetylmuramoyl-L-alanine--D-glutamate ligase [Erythrobacter sp. Alg231-14]|uniref:UDP-N-acetylmuramoyl-L-alanine--D-glutamate ligase n=1 Tax=Erythrobacter sp. Alg231-14 TaxID=1922225 RepID=UPI000D54D279
MITSTAFADKRYAILGLARSGAAAAEALLASGADVTVWDRQPNAREPFEGRCTIADPLEMDLTGFDGLVVSPGVPLNTHPIAAHAAQFGAPIIGDIELFAIARPELPPHKVIGVTGTNGKSTTVALIHHILRKAGIPSVLGGNIGEPIMAQKPLAPNDRGDAVYVLELSSYQIDLTFNLDCDVAALTNITPDHLDRYAGFEAYAASKARLFAMQSAGRVSVLGESMWHDHRERIDQYDQGQSELWCNPNTDPADPFGLMTAGGEPLTAQADWPSLQGPHNYENAIVAIMMCQALNLSDQSIAQGLQSYRGLPHRMERLCTEDGVLFINDSKATNTASTAPALAAFPSDSAHRRVHWIVGGLAKEDGLGECANHLGNVAAAYTVGEAGPRFAELLDGNVPNVERCELVGEAVRRARSASKPGDVVLFSPACASFDQFRDYEKRGEHFRQVVGVIAEDGVDCTPAGIIGSGSMGSEAA